MRKGWTLFCGCIIVFIFVVCASITASQHILTVAFLDIGQGDSIFIQTPSGRQILIDGGPNRKVISELSTVMPPFDRSIDIVINTHPDKDHIGGLPDVLQKYKVSAVIDPHIGVDKGVYAEYEKEIEEKHIPYITARRGQTIDFGDGTSLQILFPDHDVSKLKDANDGSVIAHLVYGETEVMLTGDAPKSVETYLVGLNEANLKSDILKAGHHGSRTSSGENFVHAVAPIYAVISAGKDNSYGHPHKETMDTFTKLGIQTFSTAEEGRVVFESDGKTFSVK